MNTCGNEKDLVRFCRIYSLLKKCVYLFIKGGGPSGTYTIRHP